MYSSTRLLMATLLVMSVAVGAAHADLSFTGAARYLGMGNTGIALADDLAAVDYNPANLGVMGIISDMPARYWEAPTSLDEKLLAGQVLGSASLGGDLDLSAGYVGAMIVDEVHKKHGFSVGWKSYNSPGEVEPLPKTEDIILGYGHQYYYENWCWGFSYLHSKTTGVPTNQPPPAAPYRHEIADTLQVGGLTWFAQDQRPDIRAGAVIQDLLNNNGGPFINVGVAVPLSEKLVVAVDWNDIFNSDGTSFNVGAEWAFDPAWRLRAGDANVFRQSDTDDAPTVGVGWIHEKWQADLAYVAPPEGRDTQWVVSGSYTF
ncbi:MAG: hypothetical protein GX100_02755 [candidate division WS1 bacterium]|nr:hypothetical protein [candidate division WS1 bacterium]